MKAKARPSQTSPQELEETRSKLVTCATRVAELELLLTESPVKVELVESKKSKGSSRTVSETIKDQLLIVSFLIFYIGIISTHTYYAVFGIKYQFLDLPTFHIVYYGLTLIFDAPYLILPYLVAVGWLALDGSSIMSGKFFSQVRLPLTYVLIVILLIVSYPLARLAGQRQADLDLHELSCKLPKIVNLEFASGEKFGLQDQYRLLVVDSSYAIFFKPLDEGDDTTLPNIKRYPKSDIKLIETVR